MTSYRLTIPGAAHLTFRGRPPVPAACALDSRLSGPHRWLARCRRDHARLPGHHAAARTHDDLAAVLSAYGDLSVYSPDHSR
ncbi:hypothetical protein LT493_27000 [Streptomyces tricolor]|nr:hypothetical protein [Streptomyces tricolor]